jgi:hypothetical protein
MYTHKYDNTIAYETYVWSKIFEGQETEYFEYFVVYYKMAYTLHRKHKAFCATNLKMDPVVSITLRFSLKLLG